MKRLFGKFLGYSVLLTCCFSLIFACVEDTVTPAVESAGGDADAGEMQEGAGGSGGLSGMGGSAGEAGMGGGGGEADMAGTVETGGTAGGGGQDGDSSDECGRNRLCDQGEICVRRPGGNRCQRDCRSPDFECPEGERCDRDTGACQPMGGGGMMTGPMACSEDEPCPQGQVCFERPNGSSVCRNDCREGMCPEGAECDPERGVCIFPPCDEGACPDGLACHPNDRCLPDCRATGMCPGMSVCNEETGVCDRADDGGMNGGDGCRTNQDCPDGQRCNRRTRMCQERGMMDGGPDDRCRDDEDCPEGQRCNRRTGMCQEGGMMGGAGGAGGDGGERCRTNDDCPDEQRCNRRTRMCQPDDMMGGDPRPEPIACSDESPCPEGQICSNERCRPDCRLEGNECRPDVDCDEETGLCGRAEMRPGQP